jgi:hypothetical protein
MGAYQSGFIAAWGSTPGLWFKLDTTTPFANSGTLASTQVFNGTYVTDPYSIDTNCVKPTTIGAFARKDLLGFKGPNFTFNFWFRTDSKPTANIPYVRQVDGTYSISTSQSYIGTDGKVRFAGTYNSVNSPTLTSTTDVCDGYWHMITIRRTTSTTCAMFIDGVLEASSTSWPSANSFIQSGQFFFCEKTAGSGDIYFDELAVQSVSIGNTNITNIFNLYVQVNKLKYWDGTAWAKPLSVTQWDGSSWATFNGKIWNGSVWQDIL